MEKRGWSKEDIDDMLINYSRRFKTTVERWKKVDGKSVRINDGKATVFFKSNNKYVIINDSTNEVVQVSNKSKLNWVPNWNLWTEF